VREFLPFVVIGVVTGSVYGLAAVGLTLTYKTSGILNFGHGAIATAAAYVFYFLRVDHHWPVLLAFVVAVPGLGCAAGFVLEMFARRVAQRSTSLVIVGTVGIILLVQGLASEWKGTGYLGFPKFLPLGRFRVLDVNVTYEQLIIFSIGLAATGLVHLFLRRTSIGFAMRAVVDDPDLLGLTGISPITVRRFSWMIGSTLACLAGVLLAPSLSLDAILLTMLVVQAFGAAAVGLFSSLPGAYLGGLVVGLGSAITTKYASDHQFLAGVPSSFAFVVLFLVLVFVKRRKLAIRRRVLPAVQTRWQAPLRVRLVLGAGVLIALMLVPQWAGFRLPLYIAAMAYTILFMSLGLLTKISGQVSLCHLGFAALGATSFSHFAADGGMPWPLAVFLAGLVAVPAGAVVAIPAIRVSGAYLALATLGFGVVLQNVFYKKGFMFGSTGDLLRAPRPSLLSSDTRYYYLVLAIAIMIAVGVGLLHRSRMGRLLRGLSDSPVALTTLGVNTNVTLVTVFCISAFLAGVFGAVYAAGIHVSDGQSFAAFTSLTLLVVLAIIPGSFPWYALVAAVAEQVLPNYLSGTVSANYFTALFGAAAIQNAVSGVPTLSPKARDLIDRIGGRKPIDLDHHALPQPLVPAPIRAPRRVAGTVGALQVSGLSVRFGGVSAVSDLSFSAPVGQITGLIGPNGAGKTTTFDACSGLVSPSAGSIELGGKEISHLSASARARVGLGRTFQRMALFESLSVIENVELGSEAPMVGRRLAAQLLSRPGDRAAVVRSAQESLELCGIASLSQVQASALSTGQRRLVELARCLAGPFGMLLLDEPSSGLDRRETERFGLVLKEVVAERGIGIVLVEHDMSLVMDICSNIYVLDFGELIFEGSPESVSRSSVVRAAYLGSDAVSIDPVDGELTTMGMEAR
jgi:ABC-type branched-subunit amino acid transport system ATPase component/branched-subunit amino acid ABC-type transport system permease component